MRNTKLIGLGVPAYISIDCESDGLWGPVFMIGVSVLDMYGNEIENTIFSYKGYENCVKNQWVKDNVIPVINLPEQGVYTQEGEVPLVHIQPATREKMLQAFSLVWLSEWKQLTTIWHMGHVVESGFFHELHSKGYIGDFDAPYTPIEVSAFLKWSGNAPDSVDNYAKRKLKQIDGSTHDPLFDARVTAQVYFDIISKYSMPVNKTDWGPEIDPNFKIKPKRKKVTKIEINK